jgi:hypothetical protein
MGSSMEKTLGNTGIMLIMTILISALWREEREKTCVGVTS